jgi:hypothetical protein
LKNFVKEKIKMKKKICAAICIITIILLLVVISSVEAGAALYRLWWGVPLLGIFGVSAEIGGFNG